MIIKVDSGGTKLFFDRIQYVSSQKVNYTSQKDLEDNLMVADYNNLVMISPNEGEKFDRSLLWLIVQRETLPPSFLVLAMEGDVYLLNDINGKTIERL